MSAEWNRVRVCRCEEYRKAHTVIPSVTATVPCIGNSTPCSWPTDSTSSMAFAIAATGSSRSPRVRARWNSTSESVVPAMCGYSDGSTAKVRSRFTEPNPASAPLCMNSQFPNRNGWQLVCWIGGPAAARTWLKNSGDSTAPVSSRRFWSFHAGSTLRKTAGTFPPPRLPDTSRTRTHHR